MRRFPLLLTASILALGGASFALKNRAMSASPTTNAQPLPYDGVRAPDFPADFPWLNSKPLSLRGLRGKVVLLDFWTYGCINCQHILPDLKRLEAKYGDQLVVISVHSAKFDAESRTSAVRNAVLRYKIEHPVLVDQKMRVWSEYAVNAWPTLVLIDPTGRVAGQVAGEGNADTLDATIAQLISKARARGELNATPIKTTLERAQVAPSPLSFPGKVLATDSALFVSDSGHNRIVRAGKNGGVEAVIGSGIAGLKDGDFAAAQFNNPQGLAFDSDKLYVADTNNHALRVVDFGSKTVRTLAGNGQQAPYMASGGVGTQARLSSPWDVTKIGNALVLAMAGNHQLWKYDLATKRVSVFAGSGAEARRDGAFDEAAFAQTSGLALDGNTLFAADSESSALRALDLKQKTVRTVAGGDLFDFGDHDGRGDAVRLQHPLGITEGGQYLYVADTYNSKIKRLDPRSGTVTTVFSSGLNEPGGLSFDNGALFIADTNNGAIKRLDLTGNAVQTLSFAGLKPPAEPDAAPAPQPKIVAVGATQIVAPGASGKLIFDAQLPAGFHLNHAAPQKFSAKVNGAGLKLGQNRVSGDKFTLPLHIAFEAASSGRGSVDVDAFVSYCSSGQGAVCKVESIKRRINFEIRDGGAPQLKIAAALR